MIQVQKRKELHNRPSIYNGQNSTRLEPYFCCSSILNPHFHNQRGVDILNCVDLASISTSSRAPIGLSAPLVVFVEVFENSWGLDRFQALDALGFSGPRRDWWRGLYIHVLLVYSRGGRFSDWLAVIFGSNEPIPPQRSIVDDASLQAPVHHWWVCCEVESPRQSRQYYASRSFLLPSLLGWPRPIHQFFFKKK